MLWWDIFMPNSKNVPASAKAQLLRRGTLSAATRQWSACWAHNPKVFGLTPGSAILLDIHAYGNAFAGSSRRTGCQGSKSHVRRDLQSDCGRAAQGSQRQLHVSMWPALLATKICAGKSRRASLKDKRGRRQGGEGWRGQQGRGGAPNWRGEGGRRRLRLRAVSPGGGAASFRRLAHPKRYRHQSPSTPAFLL